MQWKVRVDRTDGSSRIFFSTEREIDLYELEELCDAVGWSRRPMRKVRKRFSTASLWLLCGNSEVRLDA
jgi:hypothetical protein